MRRFFGKTRWSLAITRVNARPNLLRVPNCAARVSGSRVFYIGKKQTLAWRHTSRRHSTGDFEILSFPLTFVCVWFLFPWFCPVTIYLSWRPLLFPKSPPLVKLLFPLLSPPISAVRCFSRVLLTESTDGEQTLVFPIREALKISRRRSRVCRPSHIPIQHVANMF